MSKPYQTIPERLIRVGEIVSAEAKRLTLLENVATTAKAHMDAEAARARLIGTDVPGIERIEADGVIFETEGDLMNALNALEALVK